MPTETRTRPRPALNPGAVVPLPPFADELAPEPVHAASAKHAAALELLDRLSAEAAAAAQGVEEAAAADRAAAAEAVAEGKTPPASRVPKAADARERAGRAVDAAHEAARSSQYGFIVAADAARDDLTAAGREARAAVGVEAEAELDQLERLLLRRRELGAYERAVEELTGPLVKAAAFRVELPRAGRDALKGARATCSTSFAPAWPRRRSRTTSSPRRRSRPGRRCEGSGSGLKPFL